MDNRQRAHNLLEHILSCEEFDSDSAEKLILGELDAAEKRGFEAGRYQQKQERRDMEWTTGTTGLHGMESEGSG